ncbi:hypothetical protein [Kitasatospora sp. NPDC056184]|uniref:hypothetical protein n=1 Tax=Kitasatospora sp. NPDC056184 TaxID=3345738 RepID=UPI0035DDA37A
MVMEGPASKGDRAAMLSHQVSPEGRQTAGITLRGIFALRGSGAEALGVVKRVRAAAMVLHRNCAE